MQLMCGQKPWLKITPKAPNNYLFFASNLHTICINMPLPTTSTKTLAGIWRAGQRGEFRQFSEHFWAHKGNCSNPWQGLPAPKQKQRPHCGSDSDVQGPPGRGPPGPAQPPGLNKSFFKFLIFRVEVSPRVLSSGRVNGRIRHGVLLSAEPGWACLKVFIQVKSMSPQGGCSAGRPKVRLTQ